MPVTIGSLPIVNVDGAIWYVDVDDVTVDNLSDVASGSSLRRDMSDG